MVSEVNDLSHSITHVLSKILINMSLTYSLTITFQVKASVGVMTPEKTMMENQKWKAVLVKRHTNVCKNPMCSQLAVTWQHPDITDCGMLFHSACKVCWRYVRVVGLVVCFGQNGSIRPRCVRWNSSSVVCGKQKSVLHCRAETDALN